MLCMMYIHYCQVGYGVSNSWVDLLDFIQSSSKESFCNFLIDVVQSTWNWPWIFQLNLRVLTSFSKIMSIFCRNNALTVFKIRKNTFGTCFFCFNMKLIIIIFWHFWTKTKRLLLISSLIYHRPEIPGNNWMTVLIIL